MALGLCERSGIGSNDAGIDGPTAAPPDARLCFGNAPFTVCFRAPPAGSINVSIPTTFNTDTGTATGTVLNCVTPTSGGDGYCVVAADVINISAQLRAVSTGSTVPRKPLVLVAATSIDVVSTGSIDVSSHRRPTESIGAGGDATGCTSGPPPGTGTVTSGGGGGAGGSFAGAGGNGGSGGGESSVSAGQRGAAVTGVVTVRAGCPGQDGGGAGKGKGHGGGAVFLIAGGTITVDGNINAGGEGGAGGAGTGTGGGGGGAGGMIGFDAPSIAVTGNLSANGGGGGEGGDTSSTAGSDGGDANSTSAAQGGGGGTINGGDGGAGAAGSAGANGVTGLDGFGFSSAGGGGGGGGGGAGLIKGPPASLGSHVSPAATP